MHTGILINKLYCVRAKYGKRHFSPVYVYFPTVALNSLCMHLYELLHIYLHSATVERFYADVNRLESVEFRWSVALQFLFPSFLYSTFTVLVSGHSDCITGKAPYYPAVNSLLSHFSVSKNDSS